jgi:hypothetical protein
MDTCFNLGIKTCAILAIARGLNCGVMTNNNNNNNNNNNSMALVRERTVPTERPPLVGEVSTNFSVVSHLQRKESLRPYSRISRPEPLLFLPSSSSVVFTRLSWPGSRPSASQKIWWCRESNPDLWISSLELLPLDHSGGSPRFLLNTFPPLHINWLMLSTTSHEYHAQMSNVKHLLYYYTALHFSISKCEYSQNRPDTQKQETARRSFVSLFRNFCAAC